MQFAAENGAMRSPQGQGAENATILYPPQVPLSRQTEGSGTCPAGREKQRTGFTAYTEMGAVGP